MRMSNTRNTKDYINIKHWKPMDSERAEFAGEIGKLGALVPERYLDDTTETLGCRLKLMCRAMCLPILKRVVSEERWDAGWAKCLMCDNGEIEDIDHLLLHCSAYSKYRKTMMDTVSSIIGHVGTRERVRILLGGQAGSKHSEDIVDFAVKRFLKKAWRARKRLTKLVNNSLNRKDIVNIP